MGGWVANSGVTPSFTSQILRTRDDRRINRSID